MMEMKIENQEKYEARIEYFKENYIQDFKRKINVPGCDKAYVMNLFKRESLGGRLHEIFQSEIITEAHHFRNQKKWRSGINAFEAIKQFCEKGKHKRDFQLFLQALAEHDAILDVYNELNIEVKETQNQSDNLQFQHKKGFQYSTVNVDEEFNLGVKESQKQIKNSQTQHDKNDLNSIIENNLKALKEAFNNEEDYFKAIAFLKKFFLSKQINITGPLFVKNGNIKSLAFALGEIWRTQKNDHITYEYLSLYKKLFSIFKKQKIDKMNIFSCNLYKYSISKT